MGPVTVWVVDGVEVGVGDRETGVGLGGVESGAGCCFGVPVVFGLTSSSTTAADSTSTCFEDVTPKLNSVRCPGMGCDFFGIEGMVVVLSTCGWRRAKM